MNRVVFNGVPIFAGDLLGSSSGSIANVVRGWAEWDCEAILIDAY